MRNSTSISLLFIHLPWVLSAGTKEVTAPSHAHHDCCLFPRLHLPLGSGTIEGLWQQHPVTYEETHQFPCYAALNSKCFPYCFDLRTLQCFTQLWKGQQAWLCPIGPSHIHHCLLTFAFFMQTVQRERLNYFLEL